jgi:hypothetical protein
MNFFKTDDTTNPWFMAHERVGRCENWRKSEGNHGPPNLQALSSLICGAAVLLATPGSYAAAAPSTKKPIQHVVVIVQ